ncbi:hypothetical protein G6F57_002115 [Rhizopus arrhizus]|uniref:Uncharacterized protein n=1 Tax=Rhizopus oryzae TaxID=64495 RepID=A0A9P6XG04_RHIOR|nr:hypothetical protein G6F24_002372 [Rhizopus arrhizus]KAG1425204.1 hypothetical protein G6F58_002037 [Rhizopus delemar]KAG0795186.1 hypothetical protein G6F21_002297 [Rhizopus arrhizus]KAG0816682.1 hypothetical protein G6F20_003001 [Rhizopus arrhizus]KAG0837191.1 hypothetical protein G6F19_003838 [Rhizopus arrhizus]
MSDRKQKTLNDAKREVQERLAKLQKSGGLLNSQRAPATSTNTSLPPPATASNKTASTGLNLIELQRKIAEARNRLSKDNNVTRTTPGGPLRAMQRNKRAPPAAAATAQPKAQKKTLLNINEVPSDFTDPNKNPYFDPSMEVKVAPKDRRARPLKFVQPGKYIDIANQERAKAQLERLKQEITESVKKAGMQTEFDVSDKAIKRDAPPAVEWWDTPFMANKTYDDLDISDINSDNYESLVTIYVHHPVPIKPPSEVNATPVIKSLMLTTKERKKLRRQTRAEAQKEKRDKIRLGLIEPDPPKVKISNLMRVLGEEAIQDPTKVEARVRKEMQQRQRMHEKANEQRKLTAEERRAKIMNKLKEDQKTSNEVAVFKIKSCSHPKHRYKIEMNAQQHQLTGMVIINPKCNIVIVEGGPKSIKAYKKLMLRRIDWNDLPPPKSLENDEMAMDVDEPKNSYGLKEGEENSCYMVWTGQVKNKAFKKFTWRMFESEKMAREELSKWHVEHYWDAAVMATDEELAARQPEIYNQS